MGKWLMGPKNENLKKESPIQQAWAERRPFDASAAPPGTVIDVNPNFYQREPQLRVTHYAVPANVM